MGLTKIYLLWYENINSNQLYFAIVRYKFYKVTLNIFIKKKYLMMTNMLFG